MIGIQQIAQILTTLTLLLVAAHGVGAVFTYFRQPRVIGEIVGGLLLGPTLLSHLAPSPMSWVFSKSAPISTVLPIVSQVGLILLMYASGTQLRSFVEKGERKLVVLLSIAGTILPFLAGLAFVRTIDVRDLLGEAHDSFAFLLVFATAIAIASIPVISRIMMDLNILKTSFARIVIATAVIDDIVLYIVLAIALSLVQSKTHVEQGLPTLIGLDPTSLWSPAYHVIATMLTLVATLLCGQFLLQRAFRWRASFWRWDNYAVSQILFLSAVSAPCYFLGVNPMFGALAAGVVAGRVSHQQAIAASLSIKRVSLAFFIPLYFALVGSKLDLIHHFDVAFFLEFLAFACVVKALSIFVGAKAAGETNSAAINLAAALNARGGPGIVLASVTYEATIINENFFAILVLLAVVTSLIAGSWLGHVVRSGAELRGGRNLAALRNARLGAQTPDS